MNEQLAQLLDEIAVAVKAYFAAGITPFEQRLHLVEHRAPEKGEKGDRGDIGDKGDPGAPADPAAIQAAVLERVMRALDEIPPPKEGRDGRDGRDIDQAAVEQQIASTVRAAVAALPTPKDGRDGTDGKDGAPGAHGRDGEDGAPGKDGVAGRDGADGKDGAPGERGAPGRDGIDGKNGAPGEASAPGRDGIDGKDGAPGQPGKDAPPVDVAALAADLAKAAKADLDRALQALSQDLQQKHADWLRQTFDAWPKPAAGEDGRDGRDGADGKDAAELVVLDGIEPHRKYPRGTWAAVRGGVVHAYRSTDPLPEGADLAKAGWMVVQEGIHHESEELVDDARFVERTTTYTSGRSIARRLPFLQTRDCGVYRAGVRHRQGDGVTYAGSWWLALRDTDDKPGHGSKDWRLAVKRGNDGRAAPAAGEGGE